MFLSGCGGNSGNSPMDDLTGLDPEIRAHAENLRSGFSRTIAGKNGAEIELQEITQNAENTDDVEDLFCSLPYFTSTEPLPSGVTSFTNDIQRVRMVCSDGSDMSLNTGGTITGRYHGDDEDYDTPLLETLNVMAEVCGVGKQLPEVSGKWVAETADYDFCMRDDAIPGVIACADSEGDYFYLIQKGVKIASEPVGDDEEGCLLVLE